MQRRAALVLVWALIAPLWAGAQAPNARGKAPAAAPTASITEENVAATRQELMRLLRISPKLTQVLSRDGSLLGDLQYVERNNPELAQFLQTHPEVARNPEFYLFSEGRGERLERVVWREERGRPDDQWRRQVFDATGVFLGFSMFIGTVFWIVRTLLENRRWNRIFNHQTEVHNKLLDRLGTGEALLSYMQSDAGKRFLESAPIPVSFGAGPHSANPVARVLTPLQFGVVVSLAGWGFLHLSERFKDADGLQVLGILGVMVGIGFILSAGLAWVLARHLGLLPANVATQSAERPSEPV